MCRGCFAPQTVCNQLMQPSREKGHNNLSRFLFLGQHDPDKGIHRVEKPLDDVYRLQERRDNFKTEKRQDFGGNPSVWYLITKRVKGQSNTSQWTFNSSSSSIGAGVGHSGMPNKSTATSAHFSSEFWVLIKFHFHAIVTASERLCTPRIV